MSIFDLFLQSFGEIHFFISYWRFYKEILTKIRYGSPKNGEKTFFKHFLKIHHWFDMWLLWCVWVHWGAPNHIFCDFWAFWSTLTQFSRIELSTFKTSFFHVQVLKGLKIRYFRRMFRVELVFQIKWYTQTLWDLSTLNPS